MMAEGRRAPQGPCAPHRGRAAGARRRGHRRCRRGGHPLPRCCRPGTPELPLPPAGERALQSLISGNLSLSLSPQKVFLRYPKRWWPDVQIMQIMSAPAGRWAGVVQPAGASPGAPVVFGFAGGGAA